jgi:hypothetical protein
MQSVRQQVNFEARSRTNPPAKPGGIHISKVALCSEKPNDPPDKPGRDSH